MKKILHVISSPRNGASFSIQLGNAIIGKIKAAHPGSTVKETNLAKDYFPHLEEAHLASFFTPPENRTPENIEAVRHSDEAIREIMDADIIVISTPLYNFGIPSSLKAWLDHIVRAGSTFKYDANGAAGLVKGKKAYIAVASGGVYSEGPMQPYDFVVPYLKWILGFIGITDITVQRIEGTSIPGIQDTAVKKGLESIVL